MHERSAWHAQRVDVLGLQRGVTFFVEHHRIECGWKGMDIDMDSFFLF